MGRCRKMPKKQLLHPNLLCVKQCFALSAGSGALPTGSEAHPAPSKARPAPSEAHPAPSEALPASPEAHTALFKTLLASPEALHDASVANFLYGNGYHPLWGRCPLTTKLTSNSTLMKQVRQRESLTM